MSVHQIELNEKWTGKADRAASNREWTLQRIVFAGSITAGYVGLIICYLYMSRILAI